MRRVQLVAIHDEDVARQRAYYEATAGSYDAAHVEREHIVALYLLLGYIELAAPGPVARCGF
jgi:hypothetical protein